MRSLLALFFIVLLAVTLRLVAIDKRPLGFTWDEAALGYNAYSLLLTGRDEYGQPLPVVLKSFGDYKPGLYSYLAVPLVKILGLTETSTRLPSVIAGTLLVGSLFLLARQLTNNRAALFAAGTLAISPWAIHFSRASWEANVALLLTVLGALLFIQKKYLLAVIFLGLTFWTYQGAKLFTPLLGLSLVFTYRPKLSLKTWALPGLVGLGLVLPIVLGWGSQSGRLKVFSVFSYRRPDAQIAEILKQDQLAQPNWSFYLWHGELYDQLRGVVQRYTNHLSPYFLFVAGDWANNRHTTPYYGYFHPLEIILLVLGVYQLTKNSHPHHRLIWSWLLLAPLPAALSRDIVSGVRSLSLVIPLAIIIGVGWSSLSRHRLLSLVAGLVLLFFVVYWADLYFVHLPFFGSADWLVAYKPAWQIVKANADSYDKIVFTDKLGQPYIFGLFYLQIDPRTYQAQARLVENSQGDVGSVTGFDKYEFRPLFWPTDRSLDHTLFVGGQYELPEADLSGVPNLVRLGGIKYPDNTVGLKIVGIK